MAGVEGPVIGIDLGTTCSCVAVWGDNGVEIIPNEFGNRTTPSYVYFTIDDRFVGEDAVNPDTMNPLNTIFGVKRLIGRRFSDKNLQLDNKLRPYKVIINGTDPRYTDQVMIPVNYMGEAKMFTPEEITAMTLMKMKGVAEAFIGKTVNGAVISVPAFFNDSQRRATRDAGIIAGFKWIHIINEPTAVALAYYELEMKMNRGKRGGKKVLVFDLGGGTLDVSLVAIEKGRITVKAVKGDTNLGGVDFDNRMVRELVTRFKHEHDKDITQNVRALGRLRFASEKAKKLLSLLPQTGVQIDYLFEGIDFSSTITRARFEELNMDLFEKCIDTVGNCLKDARMNRRDVDDIILVGGSTRIPKVQQMLQDFFAGKELCKRVHPDEAVAYGAAMHAFYTTAGKSMSKEIILSDVTPLSLGVELHDGKMGSIISRNTTTPIKKHERYPFQEDLHNVFKFRVCEGEDENSRDNNILGECAFYATLFPKRSTNIHLCFIVDDNGLLEVSAQIERMGTTGPRIDMNHQGRLTTGDIVRMIDEAEQYKAKAEAGRPLLEAMSALEIYVDEEANEDDSSGLGIIGSARTESRTS